MVSLKILKPDYSLVLPPSVLTVPSDTTVVPGSKRDRQMGGISRLKICV